MNTLSEPLSSLSLGTPQVAENLTIVPLLASWTSSDILSMPDAIAQDGFTIKEMEDGGTVSKVHAVNGLDRPVLLIEGEELVGAQQNRVVNSTILLMENSDSVIPVSCSEQGRWEEVSDQFSDSGVIAPPSVRAIKAESVGNSLRSGGSRESDQSEVWSAIEGVASRAGTQQSTGALRDVFTGCSEDLEALVAPFSMVEDQVGFVALVNGQPTGLDCVTSPSVLGSLYGKLVRSYALEALLTPVGPQVNSAGDKASMLLQECAQCEDVRYDGVGMGMEHRYSGTNLSGSALIHEGQLIHLVMHRRLSDAPAKPFDRSYWVLPGQFLAGYYPGDVTKQGARDKVGALLDAGIRCVINLVEEGEKGTGGKPMRSYAALLTEEAEKRQLDVTYERIPIRDVSVPSRTTMLLILDAVDAALQRGQPVYVHCWGGRGRTGTVVGCYLLRHGIETREDVLMAINRLRRDEPTGTKSSPETDAQRDMVRTWSG